MKRITSLIATLLVTSSAFATPMWTNGIQVVQNIIWIPGNHGFYVSAATYQDPQGCGANSNVYFIDPALDDQTVNRLYAMLLTAKQAGNTLYVWVDGCIGGSPKFTGLQINN